MNKTFRISNEADRQRVADELNALDPIDGWTVGIKRLSRARTHSQNALFHHHCQIIADHTGDDAESVKFTLKQMFLPPVRVNVFGELREIPRKTSDLEVPEFNEFIGRYVAWASSFLRLPLPFPEDRQRR